MAKVKITTVDEPYSGMHVDFVAPCDCTAVEGMVINNDTYTVVNAVGEVVTGLVGTWATGSIVSVILDCQNKRAYLQNQAKHHVPKTVTLNTTWDSNTQTVSVPGVTATNTVMVSPAPESFTAYAEAMVRCTAQGAGTLTFTCESAPSDALSVNVAILN